MRLTQNTWVLHMVTICLLHIFFHTNDSPHHLRATSMQLWSHSMKSSFHYHICVYPCADAIAAVVLRLRWNFNSCNPYLLTLTPAVSAHTAGNLTVVRERFRVLTWAPYNRKTFTIRGRDDEWNMCANKRRWWWWWWQQAHLHKPNLSHPTPCSTSTNFN